MNTESKTFCGKSQGGGTLPAPHPSTNTLLIERDNFNRLQHCKPEESRLEILRQLDLSTANYKALGFSIPQSLDFTDYHGWLKRVQSGGEAIYDADSVRILRESCDDQAFRNRELSKTNDDLNAILATALNRATELIKENRELKKQLKAVTGKKVSLPNKKGGKR